MAAAAACASAEGPGASNGLAVHLAVHMSKGMAVAMTMGMSKSMAMGMSREMTMGVSKGVVMGMGKGMASRVSHPPANGRHCFTRRLE